MSDSSVSVIIPTLNSGSVLENCLRSIVTQEYDLGSVEIVIADGGSIDNTKAIAEKYNVHFVENKLKTGEAGKMTGLNVSTGMFIVLIDSDNILTDKNWLKNMIIPLLDNPEAVGSEPWEYTWRKEDGFIDRYCAMIGMNDPFVLFSGNYDRKNILTGKWTDVPHKEKDMGNYIVVEFNSEGIPTVGANGTVFRRNFLQEYAKGDYLFDVDILTKKVEKNGSVCFIKTKNGIIHNYCGSDISKFSRKQKRRVSDYYFHTLEKKDRNVFWMKRNLLRAKIHFTISCILLFPLVYQVFKGFIKKRDFAWFFHILACYITFWEYSKGTIFSLFKKSELTREGWNQ